jgi:transcriptional regulator with XRE-family HTH domain
MDDSTEATEIGRAIRQRRLQLDISQEAFADGISMHRAYYGAIERGERNLTLATLIRVCRGLGIRPSALLSDAGL